LGAVGSDQEREERTLTREHQQALQTLQSYIRGSSFVPVLLHGVTGSGKTEVYLRLIEETLAEPTGQFGFDARN
jgi:primosomal protein N' (replication factor Y)